MSENPKIGDSPVIKERQEKAMKVFRKMMSNNVKMLKGRKTTDVYKLPAWCGTTPLTNLAPSQPSSHGETKSARG